MLMLNLHLSQVGHQSRAYPDSEVTRSISTTPWNAVTPSIKFTGTHLYTPGWREVL